MKFLGRLRSRKFQGCLLTFVTASAFLCLGKLSETNWRDVALGALAIYTAANVAQKKREPEAPPQETLQ